MKKVILGFLFIVCFFLTSFSLSAYSETSIIPNDNIQQFNIPSDIDYVEYILVGDQWYEITYYVDGTIGIVPVIAPPNY